MEPNDNDDEQNQDDAIWAHGTKNPDYKLVEINAANAGFKSKLNDDGSYMIYGFVEEMINDLNKRGKDRRFLYEIFDKIQHELEKNGKQQTKNVYNNGTRYIKLIERRKENKSSENVECSQKNNQVQLVKSNHLKSKLLDE